MTRQVCLDNVDHAHVRVAPRYAAEHGHAVNQALLVPSEFEEAQREYPILFRSDGGGAFHAVALLGLDRGENLFLDGGEWRARYVPAALRRGPFVLGPGEDPLSIHIDLDDPRVSEAEGEPLFRPHGGNAPYLEEVTAALRTVHDGLAAARAMFDLFLELDLLRPLELRIEIGDGTEYLLPDLFTIDRERWEALGGPELERLHRGRLLSAALLVRSSLGNIKGLIARKAERKGLLVHA
jgi:SapC protein